MLLVLRQLKPKQPVLTSRWSHSAATASAVHRSTTPPTHLAKRFEAYSPYTNLGRSHLSCIIGWALDIEVGDGIGTSTPVEARTVLGLQGLMPAKVESLDIQKRRAMLQLRAKSTDMEKYLFMANLRNTNVSLFYKLICEDLEVMSK